MKGGKGSRTTKFLFALALISFAVATVQGMLYYSSYQPFFKILLVLQNSINAFGFKASVSIKDVVAYIQKEPTVLNRSVGYAYCVAVFTAPYCTISFMYKFLERVLRIIIGFRRGKNCSHVLIFGYNSDVRAMIANNGDMDMKKACVHIITADTVSSEEYYRLNKKGYRLHCVDVLKASEDELSSLLSKTYAESAKNIILFESSSIRNFSLLQLFRLTVNDSEYRLTTAQGAKISCRCEESGIGRLIAEYYNGASGGALYDLELFDLPEMQMHKVYSDHFLHTVCERSDKPLCEWDVHLLVAGLGKLGQQAVVQAMNLGVVYEKNRIVIDVFDTDIDKKMKLFANQFSAGSFDMEDNRFVLKSEVADGSMEINFYKLDVLYKDFYKLVRKNMKTQPYTYAVITIDDIDTSVNCAMQLSELFDEYGGGIPIIMRMDSDRRLAGYISSGNGVFSNVDIIDDRSCMISLSMIINSELDRRAKEYNHFYNNIAIISADETGSKDNSGADTEQEWNRLRLFRRSSSKAAAYHDEVKDVIIPRLAKENGAELDKKLEELLGREGILMRYTGSAWRMNGSETELLDRLKADSFAYSLASLEHRRWCCYMASICWKYGERNDSARKNPCMVTQEKLMETMPDMCKYDLMSLMARYSKMQ